MSPRKEKIVFGSLSVIAFPILFYLIISLSANIGTLDGRYTFLVWVFLLGLNIVILSSWMAFGWIGAALAMFISVFLALLLVYAYRLPLYYVNVLLFFGSFFLCYRFIREINRSIQFYKVEIEELEETHNTLVSGLVKHKAQNASLVHRLDIYSSVKNITELFSGSLSLDETISYIAASAHELVGKRDRTLFYLIDTENQELVLRDSRQPRHFPKIKTKKKDIFNRWVLRQKQPIVIGEVDKDFRFSQEDLKEAQSEFKSLISHPLVSQHRILGLVHMDSRQNNCFSPDDLRLLGIICDLGAVAIENAMLYQRTIDLSIRDSLTDLFVHRYFRERLDQDLERAYIGNYHVSLLMIDIDYFKDYNDMYGHTAGDILLKRLARILSSSVDPGDFIARYGGEEFACVLFETDKTEALDLAELIRGRIEKEKFWLRRKETHVTISIGTATFPVDAKTASEFITAADRSLYKAKSEQRNRCR